MNQSHPFIVAIFLCLLAAPADAREYDRDDAFELSQDAIGRLIQLYEATDRSAEADALRPDFTGKVRD